MSTKWLMALCLLIASANEEIKQLYINGYFCYVSSLALSLTALVFQNITFLDNDFQAKTP